MIGRNFKLNFCSVQEAKNYTTVADLLEREAASKTSTCGCSRQSRQASLTSKVKPLFRKHQRKNTTTARSSPQKTHAHTKTRWQLKPCTCTAHTSCGAFRTRRRRRKKGVTPASIMTQCRQTQFKWTNEKRWSLLRKTKRDGAAGDMLMQLA